MDHLAWKPPLFRSKTRATLAVALVNAPCAYQYRLLLLKPIPLKLQRPAILCHVLHNLCRYATRYVGLDFKGDPHVSSIQRRQMLDYLLHDFPDVARHHTRVNVDGTVEALKLRPTCM